MYFPWLFWVVFVVAIGTEVKAKNVELDLETNWCPSRNLKDGETCLTEFVVKNTEVKTIQVYLSPTKDHSRLFLRRLAVAPFKVNLKFKGSGELRLLLFALDKSDKIVGVKEEVIDIDQKQGWVLGDQDKRSIWDIVAPEFYYYNYSPFGVSSNESDYGGYEQESEPLRLDYSAPPPPSGFDEDNYDPSYFPPIEYDETSGDD